LGGVEADVLGTKEIVSRSDASGDRDGEVRLACIGRLVNEIRSNGLGAPVKDACHTVARPRQLSTKVGLLVVDLEPYIASTVKGIDSLALGNLGEVESHGARVVDVREGVVGDLGAGGDSEGRL